MRKDSRSPMAKKASTPVYKKTLGRDRHPPHGKRMVVTPKVNVTAKKKAPATPGLGLGLNGPPGPGIPE